MRAILLLLIILLTGVREGEAHGAAAVGSYSQLSVFTADRHGGQAAVAAAVDTPEAEPALNFDFSWIGGLVRAIQVAYSMSVAAGVAVAALALWLFISVASAAPVAVLRRRLVTSAWIATPAVVGGALYFSDLMSGIPFGFSVTALCIVWTDVYAALTLGALIRHRYFAKPTAPAQSLPLAAAAFTPLMFGALWLFIEYGEFPNIPSCKLDAVEVDLCGYLQGGGVFVAAILLLCLVICGALLPPQSNLIVGYQHLRARLRRRTSA
jgi:hypothetical protein